MQANINIMRAKRRKKIIKIFTKNINNMSELENEVSDFINGKDIINIIPAINDQTIVIVIYYTQTIM